MYNFDMVGMAVPACFYRICTRTCNVDGHLDIEQRKNHDITTTTTYYILNGVLDVRAFVLTCMYLHFQSQ